MIALPYLIAALLFFPPFQERQDPMAADILKAVSKNYKKMPGFSAVFSHESEDNAGKTKGLVKGEIKVSGSKYVLMTGNTTLICDGKVVWNIDKKIKEVSISDYEPDPEDITPEKIYQFYEKGFKYIFMGEMKVKGTIWQTIDLEPQNRLKEISKIRLFVDKQTRHITRWILFERGTNDREVFDIISFTALKKVQSSDFRFNKSKYSGYKIVDLR
jgi:outer membrane lipoprotein-sorting protein